MVTGFSNIALSLHHKNDCGGCYLTSRASLVLFQAANIIFNRIHQIQGNKMINNNNCQNNPIQYARQKLKHARNKLPQIAGLFLSVFALSAKQAFAMGVPSGNAVIKKMDRRELMGSILLFCSLFIVLALLHAVEISITTLYPWKVRDFAEEEGGKGTFTTLNDDIQRVLITILVTGTSCSIYATTIFTNFMGSIFGEGAQKYIPILLTSLTLFFVELIPKSVGVYAAESVARLAAPPVILLSKIVSPLGLCLSYLSKSTLKLFGMNKSDDSNAVSDSELRLIVTGARDSGTIDHSEQEMIQGVLNLQTTRIRELMKPRVEIEAVPDTMSVAQVLNVVRESGYSRIPVYNGEIDNITGIVMAKSVLDFFVRGVVSFNHQERRSRDESSSPDEHEGEKDTKEERMVRVEGSSVKGGRDAYVKAYTGAELASRMNMNINDAGLIENCYFVPDTANGWSVLQEMRKRRVHVAIVVDEYGGTEGLVSLEDIVEEVVGEIYDEDDTEEIFFSEDSITPQDDGSFLIRGDADLEDVDTVLNLKLDEELLREFSTVSGYMCSLAGEIPKEGDFVMASCGDTVGWGFEFLETDDKRIRKIRVSRLLGTCSEPMTENKDTKNRKREKVEVDVIEDEDDFDEFSEDVTDENVVYYDSAENKDILEESEKVERMVQSDKLKKDLVSELEFGSYSAK